ncbi:bacteriocin secretion protein [Burkholderia lata]|uniref:Bacteriocin secretion protein n=1 Tax=Burkholderia lata (strain ATCC 17760 / DSM 23089 / LMG 22485 / NCIMB 9086 / R18194 / 383) TaxID=482957 RepID=A0A6P2ZMC0_BURL3|nr:HlyD family efflux transporter periplasmic adaptor subunit [Burkholderia lata]VWD35674.1 bacteriocin secretion protein [Burkholderia lata]
MPPGDPNAHLFREEAQDAQRAKELGEIILLRPVSFTFLIIMIGCMALAVILVFVFGSYTRRTTVEGVVAPNSGLVKIYAPQPGIITRKTVLEGQHVERGKPLFSESMDLQSETNGNTQAALIAESNQRKYSLLQEIDKTRTLQKDERNTLSEKSASLQTELNRVDEQIASQRERVSIAKDGAARYHHLLVQDYISTDQFQQRQGDFLDQQAKLLSLQRERAAILENIRNTNTEISGISLRQQNQLSQIYRNVIDVNESVIQNESKREILLSAPETGTAVAVIVDVGQAIDTVRPLASIVPDGARWEVHLLVPSAAVGFVRNGDLVRVRYQAYPYQKFGQYSAHVTSIARTALSPAELSTSGIPPVAFNHPGSAFYRVIARLDSQTVSVYGKSQPLQAGMVLQADIFQERRRLYEWVLEPLYSLTGKI